MHTARKCFVPNYNYARAIVSHALYLMRASARVSCYHVRMSDEGVMSDANSSGVRNAQGGMVYPVRTSEQGRALARRRWDKAEQKAREAIARETGSSTWVDGWASIVGEQVKRASAGTRGSTQAAEFVRRAAGLVREREASEQQRAGEAHAVTLGLDRESARALLDALRALAAGEAHARDTDAPSTVDGSARDPSE